MEAGLERWLKAFGFERHPFAYPEAGTDPELYRYFVTPLYFDEVLGDPETCQSAVVFAPRGGGKTALRMMVDYHCRERLTPKRILSVPYTDFTPLLGAIQHTDNEFSRAPSLLHTCEILRRAVRALFERFADSPEAVLFALSPEQKEYLKWYLCLFNTYLVTEQLAVCKAGLDLYLTGPYPEFEFLPPMRQNLLKKYAKSSPKISLATLLSQAGLSSATLLGEFAGLVALLGFCALYVLVDGIDEVPFTAANPEAMIALIEPLLADLTLMNLPKVAFKFFLPDMLEEKLRGLPTIRPDRVVMHRVKWTDEALLEILHQRLRAFSKYSSLDELCTLELRGRIEREMVAMAQGSPRHLVRLGYFLLSEHTRMPVPYTEEAQLISEAAWQAAQERFLEDLQKEQAAQAPLQKTAEVAVPPTQEALSDQFFEQVRTQFPAPIAMVCRDFLIEPEPERRFKRMLDLFEVTMRFLFFTFVGIYRGLLPTHMGKAKPLTELLGHDGREIHLSRSIAAFPRLGKALANYSNKWGSRVQRWHARNESLLHHFLELRNEYAHGALRSSWAYTKTLQSGEKGLITLFQELLYLQDFQLLWIEALRKEGGCFIHRARLCMGDHPNFRWVEFPCATPLECERLLGEFKGELIPLHPLILYAWCESCDQKELFLYSRQVGEKLEYLSYATGHVLITEAFTEEMRAVWESTSIEVSRMK